MKSTVLVVSFILMSVLCGACTGDDKEPLATSPSATSTASASSPTATPSSPGRLENEQAGNSTSTVEVLEPPRRTGIAEVDAIVDLVYAGDADELWQRMIFVEIECTRSNPLPWQTPCLNGEDEGSTVTVFPTVGCYTDMIRAADSHRVAEELVDSSPKLRSVTYAPEDFWPAATYLVNLEYQDSGFGRWGTRESALVVQDGLLVGLANPWCARSAETRLYPPDYVVSPMPLNQILDVDRRTGIDVVDRVLDALRADDTAAILDLVMFTEVECGGLAGPSVNCGPEEAVGTKVSVIPWSQCHADYYRPDELESQLSLLSHRRNGLFAVMHPKTLFFPGAEYLLITWAGPTLALSDAGIVGWYVGCNATPSVLTQVVGAPVEPRYLLAPE